MNKWGYLGLFFATLATLMYEILLTRIFSVTMGYHFAFMAISIAMFGMTSGALIVYLLPGYFSQDRAAYHLAVSSLLFSLTTLLSFAIHLQIPLISLSGDESLKGLFYLASNYVVISIPFVFSGVCVCIALTKFPNHVSKLYAADLVGASLGCIVLIYAINLTDGLTTVIIVATLGGIGAVCFAHQVRATRVLSIALLCSSLLLVFSGVHTYLVKNQAPILKLTWIRGHQEVDTLYEKWNSYSRIRVDGNPDEPTWPFGWGLSRLAPIHEKVRQLALSIDVNALTVLTTFHGDLTKLDYLRYDVTNLVHFLRQNADVLVIGTGGGRDILSALVFEQKSVLGIEINEEIIKTVNERFGDFTGHLDRDPKVRFVNDEARSYITRTNEKFDIIQASLIDTFAATVAGAFALTENSIHTVEAWEIFLDHLDQNGILTFSRWFPTNGPAEMYRLVSLAHASLKRIGIEEPRRHMMVVQCARCFSPNPGVGTLLVSTTPFSSTDIDIVEEVANKLDFNIILTPRFYSDPNFLTLATGQDLDELISTYPSNLSAPTDDKPYFFQTEKFRDVFLNKWRIASLHNPIFLIGVLLIIVVVLTLILILLPLLIITKREMLRGSKPFMLFFASIGFGFMLIEISQMQRLIIFLGHPTYGLSVVLFALLLSTGMGSYMTERIGQTNIVGSASVRMGILLCVLMIFGLLTPSIVSLFSSSVTSIRISMAVGILLPLGFFMGMAFPLGMKMAALKNMDKLTPWFWGINGATSVCASVVAVAIALAFGITASFWMGFICYALALMSFIWASHG